MLFLLVHRLLQRLLQSEQQNCIPKDEDEPEVLERRIFPGFEGRLRHVPLVLWSYGPFWLYTTMVFVCSAIHNVLAYLENSTSFQYNFKIIGIGFGVFYVLGLLLSIVYGLLFGCLGLTTKTIHIVCLYGYGMTAYVICVLLCVLNMSLMTWLFLLYAAGTKVAYILRNIFELQVPTSKRVIIMILVIAEAGVQMLAIKFALLSNSGVPYSTATTSSTVQSHQAVYPLHMRTH